MKKSNGEGTIYYSSSKKCYIAQAVLGRDVNGKLVRKSIYAKTKSEVHAKLIDIQQKYNLGIYTDDKGLTLAKWIDKWFEVYKIHDYKRNTYVKEYTRSKTIRESALGKKHLSDIKPSDIQMFINSLTLSPKSIKNLLILLNGAMKQAVAEKYILVNPCNDISTPKLVQPQMVALDKKQKELFLEVAKDNPYYDIFVFALNTGMRLSEICGLTRSSVDLLDGFITIDKQLVYIKGEVTLDTPKTERSIRKVPINITTRRILEKFMFSDIVSLDFVFINPVTKGQLLQDTLSANCRKVMQKCYQVSKDETFNVANFHTLRHTFATSYLLQGGNVNLLSKILGHTSTAFTMKVYVQPSNDDIKNEMLTMQF